MNIKQLKSMIADLPDDMPVVECRDGGGRIGTEHCWYNLSEEEFV